MGNIEARNHPDNNPLENRMSLQKWVFDRYKIDPIWLMAYTESPMWDKIAQDPEYFSRFLSLSGKSKQLLISELEHTENAGVRFGQKGMISGLRQMNPREILTLIAGGEHFRKIFWTPSFQERYMRELPGTRGNALTPLDLCNEVNNTLMRSRGSLIVDQQTGGCILMYMIRDPSGSMKMRIFDPLDFDMNHPEGGKTLPMTGEEAPPNQG